MAYDGIATCWANKSIDILAIPVLEAEEAYHCYIRCASDMAHTHNCFIRALNSILLQAPCLYDSSNEHYVEQDVRGLLMFAKTWVKAMDWHHHTEETCIFPLIEKLAEEPGLLEGSRYQHKEFKKGLNRLSAYCVTTPPRNFRWAGDGGMKEIFDSFIEPLVFHLQEEIKSLLALKRLDGDELTKVWDEAERVAKGTGKIGMLYDVFPLVLGNADRTHAGGNKWPPLPVILPYLIKFWFSRSYADAWKFNSSNFWGMPIPPTFKQRHS